MKLQKLLIPTDFSDQSEESLAYGLALAREAQAAVYLLHSYYIPVNTIETAYIADQSIWLEQARQAALEEMKLLEERWLLKSGLAYECMVHPGPAMGDINKTISQAGINLVVMGIHQESGSTNFYSDLFEQAIRHARAPVLLLPPSYPYRTPVKAVFAADLKTLENKAAVQNLNTILQSLEIELELLHVQKSKEELSDKKLANLQEIRSLFSKIKPRTVLIEAENTEEGIIQYAQKQEADWLLALSHHYGLLEGIFHSSHTKKLARQTTMPLLVAHE